MPPSFTADSLPNIDLEVFFSAQMRHLGDNAAPGLLAEDELLGKLGVNEEVGEVRVALVGLVDVVQEHRADNAPALQHQYSSRLRSCPFLIGRHTGNSPLARAFSVGQ